MSYKKYEKILNEEEKKERKLKGFNFIKSYDIGFEGETQKIELEIENNIYDEYIIGVFSRGKTKKLKTKKIKEDNQIRVIATTNICGEHILYGRNVNKAIILEAIVGIMLFFMSFGYAYSNVPKFRDKIEDIMIETFKLDTPTAPEISGGSKIYSKERIIKIVKDARSNSGISYYEYCINTTEDMNKCEWKKTETKNALISTAGEYYIAFRGVSKSGNKGKISNIEKVFIDNELPIVKDLKIEIKENKVYINIIAEDKLSGLNKIYYKIDEQEYIEISEEIILELTGKHTITFKIDDHAGNELEISREIIIFEEDTKEEENEIQNTDEVKPENPVNPVNPSEPSDETNTDGNDKDTNEEEKIEYKVPIINLDKVPKIMNLKEEYDLPSYYWFDDLGGEVECELEDKTKVKNTNEINVGVHTISCEARGNNGYTTKVKKEIEVIQAISEFDNFVFDGWIQLTLYYPENATEPQWRLANENSIRDGQTKNTEWTDYIGPITVRLSDVENIYIRYKINGVTYVKSPSGKIAVDIEPQSFCVRENQTTGVSIYYEQGAQTTEYRIDSGEWQKYDKLLNVSAGTLIEARAIKEEKVYDNEGNYVKTIKRQGNDSIYISLCDEEGKPTGSGPTSNPGNPGGGNSNSGDNLPGGIPIIGGGTTYKPSTPSTYLEGPIISATPQEIVESVNVSISTKESAEKIYYKIANGSWNEYTEEFEITQNLEIASYYIRESDGKRSDTSYYYIDNIKQPSYPYVRIDIEPSRYLDVNNTSALVTISGKEYERLEYSFDGNLYIPYTESLKITKSCTVYARAINSEGNISEVQKTIIGITPPKILDTYDVSIYANPSSSEVQGLINKTEISINYDSRATKKYYKIGWLGELKEYTGPFEITTNDTIYAYATSDDGYGETTLTINYLTTGISAPRINFEPETEVTNSVKVTIEYAKNSDKMKYKIDNGDWIDYTGEFTVTENCTIYAMNEDVLKNSNTSSRRIKNIAYIPQYTLIDKGAYFILKLNYPDSSNPSTREYRWATNEWKTYNPDLGILLIKSSYKDIISADGVKIEDENGKDIIYTDHYYVVDVIDDSLMNNLFMRWDTGKPKDPTIDLSEEGPTKKLEVSIIYDNSSKVKKYKIVKPNGEDSGWLDYKTPIEIEENNTIIYAKGQNSAEVWGNVATRKITNIDDIDPTVTVKGDLVTPKQKVTLQIVGQDNLGIDKVGFVKGEKDSKYCRENAAFIKNNGTFTVEGNGKYTVCAIDKVDNVGSTVVEVTNIDLDAPDILINILTKNYGTVLEFEVDYKDSTIKQYKIGENGTYKNYVEKVMINSNDVLDLANADGSLTIFAKGTDSAGNEKEVSEITYIVDLDAPQAPVINASAGYPILTEYGVKFDDALTVSYDKRDDILNYISLDGGATWKEYTGIEHIQSGTVMAKSVKKVSGLTVSSSKKVTQPSDAALLTAFDGDYNTYMLVRKGYAEYPPVNMYVKLYISPEMQGKGVTITANQSSSATIQFNNEKNEYLASISSQNLQKYDFIIPENALYMTFTSASVDWPMYVYEIEPSTIPIAEITQYYPEINEYGIRAAYNEVKLNYRPTSVKKLYRIDGGSWEEYSGRKIKVEVGQVLEAKGIDRYGKEGHIYKYESKSREGSIEPSVFDGDYNTYMLVRKGYAQYPAVNMYTRLNISPELRGKGITITANQASRAEIRFYNEKNEYLTGIASQNLQKYDYILPKDASYMLFYSDSIDWPMYVYEIEPSTIPIATITQYYPEIRIEGVRDAYNEVSLEYRDTTVQKLYRIDESDWKVYKGDKIILEIGQVLEAKGIDRYGKEGHIYKYESMRISGAVEASVYDGNEETYMLVKKGYAQYPPVNMYTRLNLSPEMKGKNIIITAKQSTGATIQFNNEKNEYLAAISGQNLQKFEYTIPDETSYLIFSSASIDWPMYVYEIQPKIADVVNIKNITPQLSTVKKKELTPKYQINNVSTGEKLITINYPQGYTNEYSIDGRQTWNEYTGEIKINNNTTVYARTVLDGKVISSSSIKVTSIVESSENNTSLTLEIPDEINVGDSYTLPNTEDNKCYINDEIIDDTKMLQAGTYEMKCYVKEELVIQKNIIVKEKE